MPHWSRTVTVLLLLLAQPLLARADSPGFAAGDTRYLVMGDSLGAGQGAVPQTQGYAYLLYAGHQTPTTTGQWREWDTHIRSYFQRANARRAWGLGASSYDPRFTAYIDRVLRGTGALDRATTPA